MYIGKNFSLLLLELEKEGSRCYDDLTARAYLKVLVRLGYVNAFSRKLKGDTGYKVYYELSLKGENLTKNIKDFMVIKRIVF